MEPVSENYGQTVEDGLIWRKVDGLSWRDYTEVAQVPGGQLYRTIIGDEHGLSVAMAFVPVVK